MAQEKSASLLEEERHLIEQIRSAKSFTAHIRVSPHEKYTIRDIPTAEEALAEADRLTIAFSKFGRHAIVYAITPQGYTVPCTKALVELADMEKR